MFDDHPLAKVLTSMPGVGVRTGARILLEVGDGTAFATAGHLASYAGIAPITHRSGTSIRGEHPARSGNHKLKRALFLSAFAALHDSRQPPLRPQTRRRQETQRRPDLPGRPPLRRPLRHAENQTALPQPHSRLSCHRPDQASGSSASRALAGAPRCHQSKASP